MSISIDKIVHSIKSIQGHSDDVNKVSGIKESYVLESDDEISFALNEDEKKVILMLESSGFFEKDVGINLVEKIKAVAGFISDNIVDIHNRTYTSSDNSKVSTCPSCGAVGISGAVFCYNCGVKLKVGKSVIVDLPTAKWKNRFFEVVKVPGFEMAVTPITQEIWNLIMHYNPSFFKGSENPVDQISWYDAIYFCNCLSEACGYAPCYIVNGSSDVRNWNFTPNISEEIEGTLTCNFHSNGFRLPTIREWGEAAKSRDEFIYAGSNDADEVAWCRTNSQETSHPVCLKKSNSYGIFDMSGNIYEWCWDQQYNERFYCGGSWDSRYESCEIKCSRATDPKDRLRLMGLRVVRSL